MRSRAQGQATAVDAQRDLLLQILVDAFFYFAGQRRFAVRGRETYLQLRNGVAKSKFTYTYIETTLGTLGTFRNWRTVLKVADLATA